MISINVTFRFTLILNPLSVQTWNNFTTDYFHPSHICMLCLLNRQICFLAFMFLMSSFLFPIFCCLLFFFCNLWVIESRGGAPQCPGRGCLESLAPWRARVKVNRCVNCLDSFFFSVSIFDDILWEYIDIIVTEHYWSSWKNSKKNGLCPSFSFEEEVLLLLLFCLLLAITPDHHPRQGLNRIYV